MVGFSVATCSHHAEQAALDAFLAGLPPRGFADAEADRVTTNLDLVRSAKDVPIALALLDGRADIFVTNDRDFTAPGATAERLNARVRITLVAVFLRDVLGWSPEALETIRDRRWEDLARVVEDQE